MIWILGIRVFLVDLVILENLEIPEILDKLELLGKKA